MRIVAGKYRGRKLAAFAGEKIRPTPDRVKESLFEILTPRLTGARVLDLFSGSGALGLECLSRGASEAVFNDGSAEGVSLTRKNLALLGIRAEVRTADYAACLSSLKGQAFDLIFCDPPYAEDYCEDILSRVAEYGLLKAGGLVVYESEREESAEGWRAADYRRYGRVKVFFFEREP